jgi:hypothetical protein
VVFDPITICTRAQYANWRLHLIVGL